MPPEADRPERPDESEPPVELDRGLELAFGGKRAPGPAAPSDSVIARIGAVAGRVPRVSLREVESTDQTPMLKPLTSSDGLARETGKYVVHGMLGQGGVGAVHRGHDSDLGRDVAIKFLHDRYTGEPSILQRFVEEAQIGGQLQHPGIVPVYDIGLADGRPFFTMKLIKGATLAKKLAERSSPQSDRRTFLGIFESICQTMAYAHARGVVHRDLKPANVMIGSFGEVQVVDWGMGKVLGQGGVADERAAAERHSQLSVIETVRSGGHGTQSLVGSVMGTPAYMPPEQARGDVAAMDERSDVFALGAILCEILTGLPPYVGEPGEMIAMAAMAKLDDAHARLARCGAEPAMIELATQCLMPAPSARPKSAEVVAKGVHDHLAAVEARVQEARVEAAEARVRAAALRRTQKLGIGLAAVIVAALIVSLWYWRSAVEQTEVATRELARAVEIKRLLKDMLKSVTPEQARGKNTELLEEILDNTSKRLGERAIEDEVVAAELHSVTGQAYVSIGAFAKAEPHLTAAAQLRERVLGPENADTLGSEGNLASLYGRQGRLAESEALLQKTLEAQKRVLGEEHQDTLSNMNNLGVLYAEQGRLAESESMHRRTREIEERVLGEEHPATLSNLSNLATVLQQRGRYHEAETLMRKGLEIERRTHGEESPGVITGMGNLAFLYSEQGRLVEAEELMKKALKMQERVMGPEHPSTFGSMGNLAMLYSRQGRNAEALELMQKTLEIEQRALGEEHPMTLATRNNIAVVHRSEGRYAEAEALHLSTLEIQKRVLGKEHPSTLSSMANLATLYRIQRRFDEAEKLMLDGLQIEKRVLGEQHPSTLSSMGSLAYVYFVQGRHAEAEELFTTTLEADRRVLGDEHSQTLGVLTNFGLLYNAMGRFEEAAKMFETSLPLKMRVLGLQHPWTGIAASGLEAAYRGMGKPELGPRKVMQFAIALAEDPRASAMAVNAAAWQLLTGPVEELRDAKRALVLAQRACQLAEKEGSKELWNMLDTLALAQHRNGDTAAAVVTQRRAVAVMPEGGDPGWGGGWRSMRGVVGR
ncbi:MAG: serine/threonine protein kinase [Planctomycetes bacterium]|nr:serine/threonine protein kinase [Planctomycetota bacterium]